MPADDDAVSCDESPAVTEDPAEAKSAAAPGRLPGCGLILAGLDLPA
jgi:hypothetical protein